MGALALWDRRSSHARKGSDFMCVRWTQIELEKARRDASKPSGGKGGMMIEEVDGDSDDELHGDVVLSTSKTSAPNVLEFERLKREQVSSSRSLRPEPCACSSLRLVGE